MKIRTTLIIISILLLGNSCTEFSQQKSVIPSTESEKLILNFIRIQINYLDATVEWHHVVKDYNIYFDVISSKDTLEYDIHGGSLKPTWPVDERFKYCYCVDNHYVFSNKKLFTQESLPMQKILRKLDPKGYDEYMKTKERQCPKIFWDSHSLRVRYIKNNLVNVNFGRYEI